MRSVDELSAWVADQSIGQAGNALGVRPGTALSHEQACALLDRAADYLDHVLEDVCKKYSHFALLVAIQHHNPFLLVTERPDQDGDSQELFAMMSIVAFKYASRYREAAIRLSYCQYRKNADNFWDSLGDSLREDLVLLQLGVRTQRSLLNIRRTVHKGATLRLGDSGKALELEYPNDVRDAINVYENRAWRSANALGWQGFFIPIAPLKDDTTFDFPLARIDWGALRTWDGHRPLVPSPFVVSLDSLFFVFNGTLFFERQIAERFGATVYITDLFAFLQAVWTPTVARLRQGIAPYGWGYDFWSWRSFRNMISTVGPNSYVALIHLIWKHLDDTAPMVMESLSPRYWLRVYRRLLDFLSYDARRPSDIQHRQPYPTKFLFRTEQGIFAHLGLFPYFLHSFWSEFEMTGDIGSQKGPAFEQMAYAFLQSEGLVPVWEPGKPFPFKVGKRVGTDIDLFFRKGTVGFVISCKAYANTQETYEGDRRAVWLRWTELQSWVKENDELASAMVQHASEIGIPEGIEVLLPVVCVPHVEYIWDTSSYYMLTDGLPRVLTPWELREWAASVSEESLRSLPHVRSLERH